MKINKQSLILGLVIGIVVGGIAMGLLDANRPKPFFSSANGGGGCGLIEAEINRINDYLESVPDLPNESYEYYQRTLDDLQLSYRDSGCLVLPQSLPEN